MDKMKSIVWVGILLFIVSSLSSTFIRQYSTPGEVITQVKSVQLTYDMQLILALEGYKTDTNTPFTRVQCLDESGEPNNDCANAYAGEPGEVSSGVFAWFHHDWIGTPFIEATPDSHFVFRWRYGYSDHNENVGEIQLPDSIRSIIEFPTVIAYIPHSGTYLIGGKADVNGSDLCFILSIDYPDQEDMEITYVPGLQHITGISYSGQGYYVVGQAEGHTGKMMRVDYDSNIIWQQVLTDGADGSATPDYTAIQCMADPFDIGGPIVLSYQDMDRVKHIAIYDREIIESIYAEQLDTYQGSIPLSFSRSAVGFSYVNNGIQYFKSIDIDGSTITVRELPGIEGLGNNSLTYYRFYEYLDIIGPQVFERFATGGCLPGGGYYVASLIGNQQAGYDVITQPEQSSLKAYPNPFERFTHISFEVKKTSQVKLEVFNIKGQKVATLLNKVYPKGKFMERWIPKATEPELPGGVYIICLETGNKRISRKVLYRYKPILSFPIPAK